TAVKPICSKSTPRSFGSGAVYSTNSKPSVPCGFSFSLIPLLVVPGSNEPGSLFSVGHSTPRKRSISTAESVVQPGGGTRYHENTTGSRPPHRGPGGPAQPNSIGTKSCRPSRWMRSATCLPLLPTSSRNCSGDLTIVPFKDSTTSP